MNRNRSHSYLRLWLYDISEARVRLECPHGTGLLLHLTDCIDVLNLVEDERSKGRIVLILQARVTEMIPNNEFIPRGDCREQRPAANTAAIAPKYIAFAG